MNCKIFQLLLLAVIIAGCKKDIKKENSIVNGKESSSSLSSTVLENNLTNAPFFAMGADVGWLAKMEATHAKFYHQNGTEDECMDILKEQGVNSLRFRVWVNPAEPYCAKDKVIAMAIRAKAKGFKIMIDFHYSDHWADVVKQNKPAAWANHTFSQLLTDVYDHTFDVLDSLKDNGVLADWVQVGNETNKGMLLPDGSVDNWSNLAQLMNQGYAAVKAVNPNTQVIIHFGGFGVSQVKWYYKNLIENGTNFDIVGLSYYPGYNDHTYDQDNPVLQGTMNSIVSLYDKPVMIVETGNDHDQPDPTFDGLNDLFNRVSTLSGNKGLGVFYWEPQAYMAWSGYKNSAFSSVTKSPTRAMDAYRLNPSANLLLNYDFENGITTTSSTNAWKTWTDNNASSVFRESGGYTRVTHLTHKKNTAYKALSYQNLSGIPNGTYMLTAWVKNGGGQTTCQMYAKGFGAAEKNIALPVTNTWTQITINDIVVTNGSIEIGLWSSANANNWCSMDNVHLQLQ